MGAYPGNYKFNLYQGDTLRLPITYKQGPLGAEVGVDLTGATLAGQVRLTVDDVSPTATFTVTADADQGTNPGLMEAVLDELDTANLSEPQYLYDIEITWPNGDVQTILYGTITMRKEVTR